MAHDVFITYSSKDKNTADSICCTLEANAIRCWYAPRDIRGGANWPESIMDGLANSRLMILVWSANANVSAHVKREVHHAFNKGLTVIPFRIEDVAPTKDLQYFLESVQWLDASTPPLENSLLRLVEQVQTFKESLDSAPQEQARETERERTAEEASVLTADEERRRVSAEARRRVEADVARKRTSAALAEQERRRVSAEARKRVDADVARKRAAAALAIESQRKRAEK